jgi:hypothetical protein
MGQIRPWPNYAPPPAVHSRLIHCRVGPTWTDAPRNRALSFSRCLMGPGRQLFLLPPAQQTREQKSARNSRRRPTESATRPPTPPRSSQKITIRPGHLRVVPHLPAVGTERDREEGRGLRVCATDETQSTRRKRGRKPGLGAPRWFHTSAVI